MFSKPSKTAVVSYPGETIKTPYLGNLNDVRPEPIPSSGYARAQWYSDNSWMAASERPTYGLFTNATGQPIVGVNQRGVNGALRDVEWTDGYFTGYIDLSYPEQITLQSPAVGDIWGVQVRGSQGLNVPGEDQVYVTSDTQTVWT